MQLEMLGRQKKHTKIRRKIEGAQDRLFADAVKIRCPKCQIGVGKMCPGGHLHRERITAVQRERVPVMRRFTQTVGCPRCGAIPGEPCLGRRGPRISNHRERLDAAGPAPPWNPK